MEIVERIGGLNWAEIGRGLDEQGFALTGGLLTPQACDNLAGLYDSQALFRKTINMERYRFGVGEYKYFSYPLPELIEQIRHSVYCHLAPIASNWMALLGIGERFPASLEELLTSCHEHGQTRPTPLMLKYEKSGYNALHQDLYGKIFFPLQLVLFLDEPGRDYQGGQFMLVEQRPRAQSKATALAPGKGDMLIFTTNFRPVKGSRGYYRVSVRHGVSEVTSGRRRTLGIIFHDAD